MFILKTGFFQGTKVPKKGEKLVEKGKCLPNGKGGRQWRLAFGGGTHCTSLLINPSHFERIIAASWG
jgi:hypothetical protein